MSNTTPRTEKSIDRDVTNIVKDMLDEMESEFTQSGNNIIGRMQEMSKKLDDLERSISDLMTDAGLENDSKNMNNISSSTSSQTTLHTNPAQSHPPQTAVL